MKEQEITGITEEVFVAYAIAHYEKNANRVLASVRQRIEKGLSQSSRHQSEAERKAFLESIMRKALNEEEITAADEAVLDLAYTEKRFLKRNVTFTVRECLLDLLFLLYEFFPNETSGAIAYIDKIAAKIG